MVAGHLQQKKGHWYIVLNLHDETGKRRSKWIATHLPVHGNKRRAEEMLLHARQQHTDLYHRTGPGNLLFSDYMLQWLAGMEGKVAEKWQSNTEEPNNIVIQQAITAWLTKELRK